MLSVVYMNTYICMYIYAYIYIHIYTIKRDILTVYPFHEFFEEIRAILLNEKRTEKNVT